MKNMIKLGLLSTLLSATLLAEVKIESDVVTTETYAAIHLKITDTETNEPIIENVAFTKLSVDAGAKIDEVDVHGEGGYSFVIKPTVGCNKSANPEIKGLFSTSIKGIKGKKVEVPYTLCKEDKSFFETDSPYKNNEKQEKVLFSKAEGTYDDKSQEFTGYYEITIEGETEANYDFITLTDMSGKVLEATVFDNVLKIAGKKQILKFSGKIDKRIQLKGPESGLEVKVLFTSDGSVTKEGVMVYMDPVIGDPI